MPSWSNRGPFSFFFDLVACAKAVVAPHIEGSLLVSADIRFAALRLRGPRSASRRAPWRPSLSLLIGLSLLVAPGRRIVFEELDQVGSSSPPLPACSHLSGRSSLCHRRPPTTSRPIGCCLAAGWTDAPWLGSHPQRIAPTRKSGPLRHEVSFLVPAQCVWSLSMVSAPLPSAPTLTISSVEFVLSLPGMCDRSLLRLAFAPRPGSPRDAAVRTGRVRLLASFLPEPSTKRFCLQREELVCVESIAPSSENRFASSSPAQLRDESPIRMSSRCVIEPSLLGSAGVSIHRGSAHVSTT